MIKNYNCVNMDVYDSHISNKFIYWLLRVKLHRYFFNEVKFLKFKDCEIAESEKRRDKTVIIDDM